LRKAGFRTLKNSKVGLRGEAMERPVNAKRSPEVGSNTIGRKADQGRKESGPTKGGSSPLKGLGEEGRLEAFGQGAQGPLKREPSMREKKNNGKTKGHPYAIRGGRKNFA